MRALEGRLVSAVSAGRQETERTPSAVHEGTKVSPVEDEELVHARWHVKGHSIPDQGREMVGTHNMTARMELSVSKNKIPAT
jgi:hypothetical protein